MGVVVVLAEAPNSALVEAYKLERDTRVKERILTVSLLEEGRTTREVARMLHCPQSKVVYWKKRYEEQGLEGLKTRRQPGRPRKVPKEKIEGIREVVEAGDWWTVKTVRELIHGEAGVLYSVRHVQRLLHAWGFSLIRPGKRHMNRASEEEIEAFKKRPGKRFRKQMRRAGTCSVRMNQ